MQDPLILLLVLTPILGWVLGARGEKPLSAQALARALPGPSLLKSPGLRTLLYIAGAALLAYIFVTHVWSFWDFRRFLWESADIILNAVWPLYAYYIVASGVSAYMVSIVSHFIEISIAGKIDKIVDGSTKNYADQVAAALRNTESFWGAVSEINTLRAGDSRSLRVERDLEQLEAFCEACATIKGQTMLKENEALNYLDDGPEGRGFVRMASKPGFLDGFDIKPSATALGQVLSDFAALKSGGPDRLTNADILDWITKVVTPMQQKVREFENALSRLRTGDLAVTAHLEAFEKKLDEASLNDLVGRNQSLIVSTYRKMHDVFAQHGLIAPHRLASIPKDVDRINQVEVIIDLYNVKIERAVNDSALQDDARERKVQALQHLMERDIEALGVSV